jgi:hypothetical protein
MSTRMSSGPSIARDGEDFRTSVSLTLAIGRAKASYRQARLSGMWISSEYPVIRPESMPSAENRSPQSDFSVQKLLHCCVHPSDRSAQRSESHPPRKHQAVHPRTTTETVAWAFPLNIP